MRYGDALLVTLDHSLAVAVQPDVLDSDALILKDLFYATIGRDSTLLCLLCNVHCSGCVLCVALSALQLGLISQC